MHGDYTVALFDGFKRLLFGHNQYGEDLARAQPSLQRNFKCGSELAAPVLRAGVFCKVLRGTGGDASVLEQFRKAENTQRS
jgi:hypothetical protein